MHRLYFVLMISCLLVFAYTNSASAWLFGDDALLTIDEKKYTAEDYKRWWTFVKEEDDQVPETIESYVDWLLLAEEAERIGLSSDPGFKRATKVFLTARTLLMLKYEEVDSQIEITDEKVREHYELSFTPLWHLERFNFSTEEQAKAAWEMLQDETLSVETLRELGPSQYGLEANKTYWVRPSSIDKGWTALFEKLEIGEFVNPEDHKYGLVLYRINEIRDGSEQDFASLKDQIYKELWRAQEDRLTHNLIFRLRDQYEVEVDRERLDALDINAAYDTFTDEPVITSNRQDISEKEFMLVVRRLRQTRPPLAHIIGEEKVREFKNDTAFNVIAQSVTNWGALDRHYELEEPFKWAYEFNYKHRLGTLLEKREFLSKVEVSDDELLDYYNQNKDKYSVPATVKLYIIDETQGPINQIWVETSTGKDFINVVRAIPDFNPKVQRVPVDHLDPDVKPVVEGLRVGETSQIFTAQGIKLLVHLDEVVPEKPLEFERVKDSVRNKLTREKSLKLRMDYLQLLRDQSEIKISQSQWKKTKEELGGK